MHIETNGGEPMSRTAKPAKHRTTVSLPRDLYERFKTAWRAKGLTPPDAFREAVAHFLRSLESEGKEAIGAKSQAQKVLAVFTEEAFANPYQELLAAWRLARTQQQIDGIASTRLDLDAWPADIYLMKVLSELLRKFDERDQFFVVTNLSFWGENTAFDHFYLLAQEDAISRGMTLHRIFLLSDAETKNVPEGLRTHLDFLQRVKNAEGVKNTDRVKVEFVSSKDLKEDLLRYGHYACIRRRVDGTRNVRDLGTDAGCLVVEPAYDATQRITRLRFVCSRGTGDQDTETRFYIDRFQQLANKSKSHSIEELPWNKKESGS
jgi:hypothetical protein